MVIVVRQTAWWYRTRWWDQSAFDITRQSGPKRWFELIGELDREWSDANLWVSHSLARVLGHFGISENRTPESGRYRSAPTVEFYNLVSAATGDAKKFLFWDSNNPSVRVRVELVQTLRNGPTTETRRRSKNIINIPDTEHSTLHFGNLSGSANFPPIEFSLLEEFPVHVDLDVRFTYYIEGDAGIFLGDRSQPFKMRLPQYDIHSV